VQLVFKSQENKVYKLKECGNNWFCKGVSGKGRPKKEASRRPHPSAMVAANASLQNRRGQFQFRRPSSSPPCARPPPSLLPFPLLNANPFLPAFPPSPNPATDRIPSLRRPNGRPALAATFGFQARGLPAARRGGPVSSSSSGAAAEAAAAALRGAALRLGPPRGRFPRRAPRRRPGPGPGAPLRRALDGHAPLGALDAPR
jgi:hypothetical protein